MTFSASVDLDEIQRFSGHTQDWWNDRGVWSPLHKLNPARLDYIRSMACNYFGITPKNKKGFGRLSVLDIGCGGGLASEPLAEWGAKVTGIDASPKAIDAARAHARGKKLKIEYLAVSAEDMARKKRRFDMVLALEILEHVADMDSLLASIAALLNPGGIALFSTVNRTTRSYLFGIVAAEYILGWVPPGMHDWNKFVRPSELAGRLQKAGLELDDLTGLVYHPLSDRFSLQKGRVDLNYMAAAVKPRKK
ncbi:MAG: bifunctional 2-polyprenyl-6-hydroxyphenol methylase/3-demethylubiquinol 3-O-methyltransferase UbiG [Alphaproteobacteria bacterium]|nr:bifunctional 2-polyprenyl-6-hydroxyphenol methylase/3-demethylubiquinol 3-O-methyltransferase UbiG [Alphaproteobacteria bacterium]